MKTVLVTGASRGVGLTTARELGMNGYHVAVMAACDEAFYPESTKTLLEAGISYAWHAGDVGEFEDRSRTIREAVERSGKIHAPVNNAGVAPKVRTDLLEMTEESSNYVIGTSIKGNMFMIQVAARQMMGQPVYGGKRGTIINISSCSSQASSVNRGEYYVSKTGISMFTKLFADGSAPGGIFVYEVRLEVIRIDMTSQVEEKYTKFIRQRIFPTARWSVPEDMAKAVRVFCSDDLCYATGNYIDVDGGFHTQRLQGVASACGY